MEEGDPPPRIRASSTPRPPDPGRGDAGAGAGRGGPMQLLAKEAGPMQLLAGSRRRRAPTAADHEQGGEGQRRWPDGVVAMGGEEGQGRGERGQGSEVLGEWGEREAARLSLLSLRCSVSCYTE